MSTDVIVKCQWLEKKCQGYQQDTQKLRKRLKRLEKLSSDRGIPSEMYYSEVQHANCLIKDSLKGNSGSYQLFMKIPSPHSYNDLYCTILPDLKKHFVVFVRTIKNYIDFIGNCIHAGPIFTNVINETNVSLRDKLLHVRKKIIHYSSLLESGSWSVSLDEVSRNNRTDILRWLNSADGILSDVDTYLQPNDLNLISVEMDDADFEEL